IVLRPLKGEFLLAKLEDGPLFTSYRLFGLDLRNEEAAIEIAGDGTYSLGGEFAFVQRMELTTSISMGGDKARSPVILTGEKVGASRPFPEIEMDVREKDPPDALHIANVHLVARPKANAAPPFRRGDANDDGGVDLSDPVYVLAWLFTG